MFVIKDKRMHSRFVGEKYIFAARTIILVASFIALAFLSTAISLQDGFYTDGFGGAADGVPLASVSIPVMVYTCSRSKAQLTAEADYFVHRLVGH